MKNKLPALISIIFILAAMNCHAENGANTLIWKSTYYDAIPNKPGIDKAYCIQHAPGTFIGNVKDQLKNGAITNKGIHLNHFTFNSQLKNGIYFMNGTLIATGKDSNEKIWHDQIHYYVYKLTSDGVTQGVWNSSECKGWYIGKTI